MASNVEETDTELSHTSKDDPCFMIEVASRSQSDTRTSDNTSRMDKIRTETRKIPKIWIIG